MHRTLFNLQSNTALGQAESIALSRYLNAYPDGKPYRSILDLVEHGDPVVHVRAAYAETPRDSLAAHIKATRGLVEERIDAIMALYAAAKEWVDYIEAESIADNDPRKPKDMLKDLQLACKRMAPMV